MFLFCYTKILNQAFQMTHTFDSEVSLHSWLLWPMVRQQPCVAPGFAVDFSTIDSCQNIQFGKELVGMVLQSFQKWLRIEMFPSFTRWFCILMATKTPEKVDSNQIV